MLSLITVNYNEPALTAALLDSIRRLEWPALEVIVVDNGANDVDPDPGQILVTGLFAGTYTVTETIAPAGFLLDDDATREVVVGNDENAGIGTQGIDDPGDTDESDFHNGLAGGSIAWEKRDHLNDLQGGATFEIAPDPTDGVGVLVVVDNGANDTDPDPGQFLVAAAIAGNARIQTRNGMIAL